MKIDLWEKEKWIFRYLIEYICLSIPWNNVYSHLSLITEANNINRGIEEKLYQQLLLHICGSNLRSQWKKSSNYKPELLREPYIRSFQKENLIKFLSNQINLWIRKLAVSISLRDTTLDLNNFVRSLSRIIISRNITHKNSKSHTRSVFIPKNDDEILGTFILEILDPPRLYSSLNYAYYPTMLTKKFTFESNSNKIEHNNYKNNNNNHNHNNKDNINNSIKKSYDKESQQQQQQALRLSILDSNDSLTQYETHHLIKEEIESESIDKSDVFKPFDVEIVCAKLQGNLLPESLRGHIWIHRTLRKDWEDPPIGPSWMNELQRLALEKGISSDLLSLSFSDTISQQLLTSRWNYDQSLIAQKAMSVSELARNVVHLMFLKGFPIRLSLAQRTINKDNSDTNSQTILSTTDSYITKLSQFIHQQKQELIQSTELNQKEVSSPAPQKTTRLSQLQLQRQKKLEEQKLQEQVKLKQQQLQQQQQQQQNKLHLREKREKNNLKNINMISTQSSIISDNVICRRAEVLVRATYIITGELNIRSASVALLLMTVFPTTQPISEKTLGFFMYIYSQCLPSEHMNHSYSIGTVATTTFTLLYHDDSILRDHLETILSYSKDQELTPRSDVDHSKQNSPRLVSKNYKPPPAYRILKDWLETGFVGYVPEFALFFIWDQLAMWGGKKRDWQQLLPVICLSILRQLKPHLLNAKTEDQILSIINNSIKYIRSKNLFEEIRLRIRGLPRPKWFSSPFSNITFDKIKAVTFIQKMYRGHRARIRFHHLKESWLQEHHSAEQIKSEKLRQEWKHLDELRKEKLLQQLKENKEKQLNNAKNTNSLKDDQANKEKVSDDQKQEKTESQESQESQEKNDINNNNDNNNDNQNDDKNINNEEKIEKPKTPDSKPKTPTPKESPESVSKDEETNNDNNNVDKDKDQQENNSDNNNNNNNNNDDDIETKKIIKELLDDLLVTLESMVHVQEPVITTPSTQNNLNPLETSRTEQTSQTNLTDYTMVTDIDENENEMNPIDEEALKKQMRSAYLKEWADMRGLVFETDDEAEKALQEFQNRKKNPKISNSSPEPTPEPTLEPNPPPLPPPPIPIEEEKLQTSVEIPPLDLKPNLEPEVSQKVENLTPEQEEKDTVTPLKNTSRQPSRSKSSRANSKGSSRRRGSLFDVAPTKKNEEGNDSDEEKLDKYDEFRKNVPQNELDALLGFFPELRAEISELLRKKRHLKLDISEWKAEFFIQKGREANWEERKEAIGPLYEKYHEVGFKANKALKELREAENDLLKSWANRKQSNTSPRRRKLSIIK